MQKGELFSHSLVSEIQKFHQTSHALVILDEFLPIGLHNEQCRKCLSSHLLRCAWLASNIFTRGGIHPVSPSAFLVSLLNERLQIEEAASCWTVECPFFIIEVNCFRNPQEETKALAVLTEAERLFIALMTSTCDLGIVDSSKRHNKV